MLAKEANQYNGFNLIVADVSSKSMIYITNRAEERGDNEYSVRIQEVSPGLHVLSNAKLDSPWPKVRIQKLQFTVHNFFTANISLL